MITSAYTPDPAACSGPNAALPVLRIAACVFALLALAACGKGDKVQTTAERLAAVQQKQETTPDFYVPRKTVDYMADLKGIKDAPREAPKEVPKGAERVSVPVPTSPSAPAQAITAAVSAPAQVATATPARAAPTPAPAPPPALPSAGAPGNNIVASAGPTARPVAPAPSTAVLVLTREQPDFPREAIRAGTETGTVRARLTIGANGEVTSVAIVQAQPARVFDRAVQGALARWKFNPGADGRTYDTEVVFQR
jgi:protein TonB